MHRKLFLTAAICASLAGCLPIELEVCKDGKVLVPRQEGFFSVDPADGATTALYRPESGKPVFGRFVGKDKLLAVTDSSGGGGAPAMFGGGTDICLVELPAGTAKKLTSSGNVTYVTVSADGKYAGFTRVSDQQFALGGDQKENLPELHIIDLASGMEKTLNDVQGIASIHRWFPDAAVLLVFQIRAKISENSLYQGVLSKVDPATGKATPLASAIGGNSVFFDLAPDGKKALFTAAAAGKADEKLAPPKETTETLFELDIAAKTVRAIGKTASVALYSRDGKKVLVGSQDQGGAGGILEIADPALASFQRVAENVALNVGGGPGGDTKVYPAWVDSSKIVYLSSRAVYGTVGKNLEMIVADTADSSRRSLQNAIDTAASKPAK